MFTAAPQNDQSFRLENVSRISWLASRLRQANLLYRCGLYTVLFVDRILRHQLRIYEFTDRPECVLRISSRCSASTVKLPDGTEVRAGDLLLELHLWNEHLGIDETAHHGSGWEIRLLKRVRLSLTFLAQYVEREPSWRNCKAVHARFVTPVRKPERTIRHLGFSTTTPPVSVGRKLHDFFETFLVYGLIWAFHPCRRSWKNRNLTRVELWLSKSRLRNMYGLQEIGSIEGDCKPDSDRDVRPPQESPVENLSPLNE